MCVVGWMTQCDYGSYNDDDDDDDYNYDYDFNT